MWIVTFILGQNSLFQCNESLNGWREVYSESGAEWINGYYDQRVFFLCDTNQKKVSVIDENGRKIHTLSGKKRMSMNIQDGNFHYG